LAGKENIMEISYTFENDIMWVAMHGKPGAKEIIKTLHRAFKDRRFIPEVTGIIYNLALFNRQTTYPEKDRKIIASFLIANPINRSAAIVSDPVRCEAANKYREYIAEYGVQHAAFCIPEHAEKFVKGDDTVPQANYDTCTTTPAPESLCRGRQVFSEVKTLGGFLPICSSCKNIRDDNGDWNQIERYIGDHSEAIFSHGICPDCARKLYPDLNL
jgi:hypothetical protein